MSYTTLEALRQPRVAYFCMEFALDESLPIYAGGLGVLAGDFMRSAYALGLPMVGVGILWEEGYTTQKLDERGVPLDLPTPLDRSHLVAEVLTVSVTIRGVEVPLKVWRVEGLKAAPLYLLEPALERDRWINDRLYGGGKDERVAQEMVLGIGGVRALEALGLGIDVYHFNEGHALFAGFELMRRERAGGCDLATARARVRNRIVFTTHTPVEAGNETHDLDRLMGMGANLGLSYDELVAIGGNPFNMTVAALHLSRRANAVAELHGQTARQMWRQVQDAAPIDAITNGVDHRVWQDARVRDAAEADDDAGLERARRQCKEELFAEIKHRTGATFAPETLTLGFARRATPYKRALLLFRDEARIAALLNAGRLQLLYGGKAHPQDQGGRELIAQMVQLSQRYPGRVLFVPNYDLRVARLLTRGCDLWVNTPRRPLEACGTSGMKAAMNGVLNCSILDGWWPEACDHGHNGWAIGDGLLDSGTGGDDALDAAALYALLEDDIVPTFYNNRPRWCAMMRRSIAMAVARFSSDRMALDYYARLYAGGAAQLRTCATQ